MQLRASDWQRVRCSGTPTLVGIPLTAGKGRNVARASQNARNSMQMLVLRKIGILTEGLWGKTGGKSHSKVKKTSPSRLAASQLLLR